MPHAFPFWILSLPRRLNFEFFGVRLWASHSGSPLLVEMRSSADAATTAKLHHRSPCKGEKNKKWIRNIENHVGLRIPCFSTKARHSKQNICINSKKKLLEIFRGHITNTRTLPASPTSVSTNIRGPDSGTLTTPSWTGTSDFGGEAEKAFVLVKKNTPVYGENGENKTETHFYTSIYLKFINFTCLLFFTLFYHHWLFHTFSAQATALTPL